MSGGGTVDAKQIKNIEDIAVVTDETIQDLQGGKTFFEYADADSGLVPAFGRSDAPKSPGRFVGTRYTAPSGASYLYPQLIGACRVSNGDRGYRMSGLALAGYQRTAQIGFFQNVTEGTGRDVGYLDLGSTMRISGAPTAIAECGRPDGSSAYAARLGLATDYLKLRPFASSVTERPHHPEVDTAILFVGSDADLTAFGHTAPNSSFRPLLALFDNGAGGNFVDILPTQGLSDARYWRQNQGALVVSGQSQNFGAGDKTFGGSLALGGLTVSGDATLSGLLTVTDGITQSAAAAQNFLLLLGASDQEVPDEGAVDTVQVGLFVKSGEVTSGTERNSYYAETEESGDPIAVPLMLLGKSVDGSRLHPIASERGMMRLAPKSVEALPGAAYGINGDVAMAVGSTSTYGAAQQVDFAAADAVIITSLALLVSARPVTGALLVRITTRDPGAMTFPTTRSAGFVAEFVLALDSGAQPSDHVQLVGHTDGAGGLAGPLVIQRTAAAGCRLFVQLAYDGDGAEFETPVLGGEYVQIGAEFMHRTADADGPAQPA